MSGIRVGQGFDVHRIVAGRPLVLCGRTLSSEIGLDGHSDADVALHAVTDAVLGAVGCGDIGEHFPPTDTRWKDADSSVFLDHALTLARERGFAPVQCDLTFVGDRPKIAPFRNQLRSGLASSLGIDPSAANIKATTTEGLGWTGRGEGLACMAVVLMEAVAVHD